MKSTNSAFKALVASALSAAMVVGVMNVTASDTEAGRPQLLCGPSLQWSCSKAGGPDFLFQGTVCDKVRYEAQTGQTCSRLKTK